MELTKRNLLEIIIENDGLDEAIDLDVLNCYFPEANIKDYKQFGKIKDYSFYPSINLWKDIVNGIILKNLKRIKDELNKDINYSLQDLRRIYNINFFCLLKNRKLKKVIDLNIYNFKKENCEINLCLKTVDEKLNLLEDIEGDLINYIDDTSFYLEDKIDELKISSRVISKALLALGIVERKKRNIYYISKDILKEIFVRRLENSDDSINNELTEILTENNIMIINSPLDKNTIDEILSKYEGFEIISESIKINSIGKQYIELILYIN